MEQRITIADLNPGDLFCFEENTFFEVFQLLRSDSVPMLVASYWPVKAIPTAEAVKNLDLKSACTEFPPSPEKILFNIGFRAISPEQEIEIDQFLKIKAGKDARQAEFSDLKSAALEAFRSQQYEEAIRLFSLAAPYSKYDIELYEKRGLSYLHLKQYSDALADFDYYLIHDPENEIVKEAAKQAKQTFGKSH